MLGSATVTLDKTPEASEEVERYRVTTDKENSGLSPNLKQFLSAFSDPLPGLTDRKTDTMKLRENHQIEVNLINNHCYDIKLLITISKDLTKITQPFHLFR